MGEEKLVVRVMKEEVVAPALPLQHQYLPLSNLDLLLPPLDVSVFFCYNTTITHPTPTTSVKKGLAKALVSFYAFAGEVVVNSAGEPHLLCNHRGVDFVEAVAADVDLTCLNLYHSLKPNLTPIKKRGVLAVQTTTLKCGGLVVACTFDHRIADAYSANMFLVSWAEMARPNKPTTVIKQPCYERSLLSPRRPGSIHPSIHHMYVPYSNLPPKKPESDPLISRIYYVTSHQLNLIQSLANSDRDPNDVKRTKLECFSAFLWKMIGFANKGKSVIVKMGIVVDGRKRLISSTGNDKQIMDSYFGNVISVPFGGKPVEELTEKPLSWVAREVHAFLEAATTEEHFLSLIDWVEAHRPGAGFPRVYCSDDGPALVVSSGQRFPVEKVDFGWGKPVFGSYHFPWGGDAGYVMPMPSPAGNGDWVVYIYLGKEELEKIECEASHVLNPLTWDYLLNNFP